MKYFIFPIVFGALAVMVLDWAEKQTKFYQPQDALLMHAPQYDEVFRSFISCVAVIDCEQETYDLLIERREKALQADWPLLLIALMDKSNWRKNPHSDLTGPWATRDGFWQMVENLGGKTFVETNCVPEVSWIADVERKRYSHSFDGLRCGESFHLF